MESLGKKLIIPFGDGKIVAEVYKNDPPIPTEIVISVEDGDGVSQNICLVRPHWGWLKKTVNGEENRSQVDCLVWGDASSEEHTDEYTIDVNNG